MNRNASLRKVAHLWFHRQAHNLVLGHIEKQALRQRTMVHMLTQGGTFGIISAYSTGSKKENQVRHGQLMADLQKLGYRKITTLKGQWDGVSEKSLLIPKIRPEHLFKLGRKYDQDAIIYKSADGVVGMYYPSGYAEVAVDPDKVMPEIEISDSTDLFSKTRNWSFNLGFLWGQKIPWDGRAPITRKDVRKMFQTGQLAI